MIYSNWLREKSHNAIKFGEPAGNPCVLKYSKGKKLKNYEIYGNSIQETRSGKNLLKNTAISQRINGVWFTVYPQGGVRANGTNSSSTDDTVFDVGTFIPDKNSTYTFSGGNRNGSETTFYLSVFLLNGEEIVHEEHIINNNGLTIDMSTITEEFTVCKVSIVVKAGISVSRPDFYPMVELGTEKTDYEQYGTMPSPDFSSEIYSVGDLTKNLFDKDKTKYKVFMHSDTITSSSSYYTIFTDVENISNFTISIKNGQQVYYGLCDSIEVGSEIYEHNYCTATVPRVITNNIHKYVGISIYYTAISALADVQIEEGTTATEYEPYHKYCIPIEVIKSRNLIDFKDINSWTKQNMPIPSNGQYYQIRLHEIFPVGTTLTFHFEVTENIPPWLYMETNDDNLPKNSGTTLYFTTNSIIRKSLTFTIREGCVYTLYPASSGVSNTTTTLQTWLNKFEYLQIELGSTQSEYEPYCAEVTNIYLNEPLRGIGEYSDYIDFRNKKVVRNIKRRDFNGSESWNFDSYKTKTAVYKTWDKQIGNVVGVSMSNRFMDSLDGDVSKITVYFDNNIYIAIDKEYAPDKKSFKTWLANNPTYAIYSIATPIVKTINLPDIITNNGDCTIRLGSNIQPSNIKVKYIRL